MPKSATRVPGAPCWINLNTSDLDRSIEFYDRLLGWHVDSEPVEGGGYAVATLDGGRVGGMSPRDAEEPGPDWWGLYLVTEDAEAMAAAVPGAGGRMSFGPDRVPGIGIFAGAFGPGGALIGVWERDAGEASAPFGIERFEAPGAPSWFELLTRDYEADVAFAERVLGWTPRVMSDTPEFRYTLLTTADGADLAGIWDVSDASAGTRPSAWELYFGTADVDVACGVVERLGGAVAEPPEDSPYGRIARVTDATGASFRFISQEG
ncbi:VOC family protein [Agromyces sp. LHK192]|uniref:VOC family protein n=1 Tax=Agromyces sp. LHK192 TaxID=2498704 RepID=UPI0013E3A5EB|nr:VOC family protein [Agromyces sp. LHK192]